MTPTPTNPLFPPLVAANAAAAKHADDLTAFGATQVAASDAGLDVTFATDAAASTAKAMVREELTVGTDEISATVPFRVTNDTTYTYPIGVGDAIDAAKLLPGVFGAKVQNDQLVIATWSLDDATRLTSLLKPEIAGVSVRIDDIRNLFVGGGGEGWNGGF